MRVWSTLGLKFLIELRCAIPADTTDRDSLLGEHSSYEEVPMAMSRLFFAAHYCDSTLLYVSTESVHALDERGGVSYAAVENMSGGIVELLPTRPAPQLVSHIPVVNA